jgi:hypothetical protein
MRAYGKWELNGKHSGKHLMAAIEYSDLNNSIQLNSEPELNWIDFRISQLNWNWIDWLNYQFYTRINNLVEIWNACNLTYLEI